MTKKVKILNISINIVIIIGLALLFSLKEFYLIGRKISVQFNGENFLYIFMLYLFLFSFTLFLSYRKKILSILIISLIVNTFLLSNLLYYRYYSNLMSFQLITAAKYLGTVEGSIFELFKVKYLIIYLDSLLLGFLLFIKVKLPKPSLKLKTLSFSLVFVISLFFNINSIKVHADLLKNTWDPKLVALEMGLFSYYVNDFNQYVLGSKIKEIAPAKLEEVKNYLNSRNENESQNPYFGIAKGKNLIVIQVEALQNFVIGKTLNGVELTPNLNKLVKNSLYFKNTYYQTAAGNTSDAEFLVNNSLHASSTGPTVFRYANDDFNSLPSILKNNGYSTFSMHGNEKTYWNRELMHTKYGFDHFYSLKEIPITKIIGWGANDNDTFNQGIRTLVKQKQPFYSMFITMSSHHPFKFNIDVNEINSGSYENTIFDYYFEAIHYTDAAIGDFLDKLDKNNLYKDSTIVIYGDHQAFNYQDFDKICSIFDLQYDNVDKMTNLMSIPFIIKTPEDAIVKTVEKPVGQIDIMPTILGLYGEKDKLALGYDALDDSLNHPISMTNGIIFYKNLVIDKNNNVGFDIKTKEPIYEPSFKSIVDENNKEKEMSETILDYNLINKLK